MFTNTIKHRIIFTLCFVFIFIVIGSILFSPIYSMEDFSLLYQFVPSPFFDFIPIVWEKIKIIYLIFYILTSFIYSHFVYLLLSNKKNPPTLPSYCFPSVCDISLYIGKTENNLPIYLSKESLYQNILVTGTIGTGKTSSAMYPFTKQLIQYQSQNSNLKLGMLILDVKGNYHEKVLEYAKTFGRLDDVIVIELNR